MKSCKKLTLSRVGVLFRNCATEGGVFSTNLFDKTYSIPLEDFRLNYKYKINVNNSNY
jgi:hypothetical protein